MTGESEKNDDGPELLGDDAFENLSAPTDAEMRSAAEMEKTIDSLRRQSVEIARAGCDLNSVEVVGQWEIAPATRDPDRIAKRSTHSIDFRSVTWEGVPYTFTAMQAACVELLWKNWENHTPEVGQDTILEAVDSTAVRLGHVFRNHPAWGVMIVSGKTKGSFRLSES